MKGVIFNLLEDFICEGWGEETYDSVLELCPLKTKEPFVGPKTYPDEDLFALAQQGAELLEIPLPDALRAFGRFCFPRLADKYPVFLQGHKTTKSFLLSVHEVIHVEVRKLFPQAVTPRFEYEDLANNGLRIRYTSERKLCHFMEGMLESAARRFGESLTCKQTACMHDGADHCCFQIAFNKGEERAA